MNSMSPSVYSFVGDGVTYLGVIGIASSFVILFTAFRRYFIAQASQSAAMCSSSDLKENSDISLNSPLRK
jgi:hypothetical protein